MKFKLENNMSLPHYANLESEFDINYLAQIRKEQDDNIHYLRDDEIVIIKNVNEMGEICNLKDKFDGTIPWIMISIKKFQQNEKDHTFQFVIHATMSF